MNNKLKDRAQKSKLQNLNSTTETKIFPIASAQPTTIRSFRLDNQSWQDLQTTCEKLSNYSKKKISANRLIKVLIYLAKEQKEEKLLKILREIS